MKRILVCEDEQAIREFVVINLTRSGYEVRAVGSGEEAVSVYEAEGDSFGAVLLDIMLPGMDGFAVCKKIREKNNTIGIIMLSAKSQEMDKVNGLMLGADDYITKPFSPSELIARVDALFRRVENSAPVKVQPDNELVSGPFVLNIRSRSLTKNGKRIDLTQVEFQLMEQFLRNPNTALERGVLLTTVWGDSYFGDDKIVDVNMRRLRMKIEDEPSAPQYLTTVWGFGYKWME
ncbi:MAG: response regulator transcription factor [Angelakisella sp.]